MKFENTEVFNLEGAIHGMRNPLNSWDKSDSYWDSSEHLRQYVIGENDLNLAQRLIKGGSEHRKFLRQIIVSVDITAPLYWYKEFDTYKVGTTANSTSTMHKLTSQPITLDCFEIGDYNPNIVNEHTASKGIKADYLENILLPELEYLRQKYLETKDKRYWKELVRWLPESWLQTRTITMNYENVRNMYSQRVKHPHKLTEWRISFGDWIKTLPYAQELIMYE